MEEITPMQRNRFECNRLDTVKKISVSEFSDGGFKQLKPFKTRYSLHYDEENGGVFVWSDKCSRYFLIGKKVSEI